MSRPTEVASRNSASQDALAALDFPWSEELSQSVAQINTADIWRYIRRLLSDSMARELWLRWNPQQNQRVSDPRFVRCFREFLADGLALGYRLNRFCGVSARLPEPDDEARNWIPFFEEAIDGDDCSTIRLVLSRQQYQAFTSSPAPASEKQQTWEEMLAMMSDGLFYELGLVFRPLSIAADDSLSSPWFRCEWNDLVLPAERGLDDSSILVNDTVDGLRLLSIKGTEAIHPANGSACAIADKTQEPTAKHAGITTWDSQGYVVLAVSAAINRAAAAFVNRSLYQLYLLRLKEFCPDLVAVVERDLQPDFVIQVLRGLLAEQISVRDLSLILEAMLELRSTINVDTGRFIVFSPPTGGVLADPKLRPVSQLPPSLYVEFVRARMKRYISHKYSRGQNSLIVYLMDPQSEKCLTDFSELSAADESSIKNAVREEIGSPPAFSQVPVILTTLEVRRRLQRLLSPEFPNLAVLSYQDLSPDLNIQPIARITADFRRETRAQA
jgi:flagellar biosynthesis component FlhA